MENIYFWAFWWATLSICAWKFIEGIRRPERMLEWPFIACAMWAYFYVYMAYQAKMSLGEYLPGNSAVLGQLLPLLCLVGIILGWNIGLRSGFQAQRSPPDYSLSKVLWFGLGMASIGAYGAYSVTIASAKGEYDWEHTSAYWTWMFYIGYPGLAMAVWAASKRQDSSRWLWWLVTFAVFAVFIYPNVHNARRGPTFPAVLILLIMPALAKRKSPNRIVYLSGLAGVGLVMLAFILARQFVYNNGTWAEAIQNLTFKDVVQKHGINYQDNEYVDNCQLIWTLYKTGKYQYGTGHLELLVHWIPRQIWKSKPGLGEGYYPTDDLWEDEESVTGHRLLGGGAAAGGVADSFIQYGFLTPLFWLGLSWLVARVYSRARRGNDPRWQLSYMAFICSTHWLVSQGFAAAFVPGMCFVIVPLLVLAMCHQDPPRVRTRMRNKPAGMELDHNSAVK